MGHCGGGPGINTFDTLGALERWREQDAAPAELEGSNPETGMERPICAWPEHAAYDGSGAIADAANWSCRAP
jgi:feruloyl esterase